MPFLAFSLRSKRQTASATTTETIPPPSIAVKSSTRSILPRTRTKKSRDDDIPHPAMTVKQLKDVMCRHPLSEYSRYPSESFPLKANRGRRGHSSVSVSSESSSLLSSSSRSSSASRLSAPSPLSSASSSFASDDETSSAPLHYIPVQHRQRRVV